MALARLSIVVSIVLAASTANAQDDFNQEVRKLLDEGWTAYRQAMLAPDAAARKTAYDTAFTKFQEAFAKNPSNDVVYAFVKRVGEDLVTSLVNSSDQRMRDTGRMILALARPGDVIRKDDATIDKYIQDLGSDQAEIWQLAFWHLKNIGPYAVAKLLPKLGDANEDRVRPRTILLLSEMHYNATLGAIEALSSPAVLLRQNAAIVLGNIRDERGLPYLKKMLEDPNEVPEVKKYCYESLMKITGRSEKEWKSAVQYFMDLAEKYYYAHPTVVASWQPNDVIWKWDADAVKSRDLPRFAFNEQLCEETLYDLLDLAPEHAGAWGLMAANHFAQVLEAKANLAGAERALALGDIEQADVDRLRTLMAGVERGSVLAHMVGKPYLYLALSRCLQDGRAEVAEAVCDALSRTATPDDLPPSPTQPSAFGGPLVEALTSADKRVRYAAARAIAKLNPQHRHLGMELVVPNLIDALGEQGIRTVLTIHETRSPADYEVVNRLRRTIQAVGAYPIITTNIPDGLQEAMAFPTEDMILLQFELATSVTFQETITRKQVTEQLFGALKNDVRTRDVPLVIVCASDEQMAQAQQIFADRAAGFLKKPVVQTELEAVVNRVFSDAAKQSDAKSRADALAQAAAEALAGIDPASSLLPYLSSVDGLVKVLDPANLRKAAIRLPSVKALGRFGDARAIARLTQVLADKTSHADQVEMQKAIRLGAAESLSATFKTSGAIPDETTYTALRDLLNDGDLDIEIAVAHTLGNASLTPQQRRDLETFKRVKRATP